MAFWSGIDGDVLGGLLQKLTAGSRQGTGTQHAFTIKRVCDQYARFPQATRQGLAPAGCGRESRWAGFRSTPAYDHVRWGRLLHSGACVTETMHLPHDMPAGTGKIGAEELQSGQPVAAGTSIARSQVECADSAPVTTGLESTWGLKNSGSVVGTAWTVCHSAVLSPERGDACGRATSTQGARSVFR